MDQEHDDLSENEEEALPNSSPTILPILPNCVETEPTLYDDGLDVAEEVVISTEKVVISTCTIFLEKSGNRNIVQCHGGESINMRSSKSSVADDSRNDKESCDGDVPSNPISSNLLSRNIPAEPMDIDKNENSSDQEKSKTKIQGNSGSISAISMEKDDPERSLTILPDATNNLSR